MDEHHGLSMKIVCTAFCQGWSADVLKTGLGRRNLQKHHKWVFLLVLQSSADGAMTCRSALLPDYQRWILLASSDPVIDGDIGYAHGIYYGWGCLGTRSTSKARLRKQLTKHVKHFKNKLP